jgi:hypothetical protein
LRHSFPLCYPERRWCPPPQLEQTFMPVAMRCMGSPFVLPHAAVFCPTSPAELELAASAYHHMRSQRSTHKCRLPMRLQSKRGTGAQRSYLHFILSQPYEAVSCIIGTPRSEPGHFLASILIVFLEFSSCSAISVSRAVFSSSGRPLSWHSTQVWPSCQRTSHVKHERALQP